MSKRKRFKINHTKIYTYPKWPIRPTCYACGIEITKGDACSQHYGAAYEASLLIQQDYEL